MTVVSASKSFPLTPSITKLSQFPLLYVVKPDQKYAELKDCPTKSNKRLFTSMFAFLY